MKKLLHTPEGVRDIYNVECGKKLALEGRLKKVFHMYGYHDIQTPTFEYFDVFRKEIGTISSRELYKFFDKDGNTLVLRPDFTPSIARAAATLFQEETLPIRLCYTGSTFVNHSSYQGRLRETTQMGAELLGDDSPEADAEMLALVIESMLTIGLKEFQLTVSNVDFLQSLIEDAALDEDATERVRELITNRNYYGVEEYLDGIQVKRSSREAFAALGELLGGVEILERARNIAPNSKGVMALKRLEKIYDILKLYGVEKFVTFDLSMTGTYGYYTGIIFRGYTYGTGDAIGKGGRYDNLLAQFGKEASASGFTILIDDVLSALSRQNISISLKEYAYSLLLYKSEDRQNAIPLVVKLRDAGVRTELVSVAEGKALEEYLAFGKNQGAEGILYLDGENVTVYDMASGDQETKTLQEFREEY